MTFNNHLDYTIGQESYIGLSTADFLVKLFTAFESVFRLTYNTSIP